MDKGWRKDFTVMKRLYLRRLAVCSALIVLFTLGSTQPAAAKGLTGWKTMNSFRYYYVQGKRVTGWNKIKGKEYYFNRYGRLMTNRIVGNKAGGYDYVDRTGQRVRDTAVRMAVALVRRVTDSSMTPEEKLETCYLYLINNFDYTSYYYELSPETLPELAKRMFSGGTGDCMQSAVAMTYIARVLGYPARAAYGFVNSYSPDPIWEHGWAEVAFGNRFYVYDITMQRKYTGYQLHAVPLSKYPFAIKRSGTYRLLISNTNVVWRHQNG